MMRNLLFYCFSISENGREESKGLTRSIYVISNDCIETFTVVVGYNLEEFIEKPPKQIESEKVEAVEKGKTDSRCLVSPRRLLCADSGSENDIFDSDS